MIIINNLLFYIIIIIIMKIIPVFAVRCPSWSIITVIITPTINWTPQWGITSCTCQCWRHFSRRQSHFCSAAASSWSSRRSHKWWFIDGEMTMTRMLMRVMAEVMPTCWSYQAGVHWGRGTHPPGSSILAESCIYHHFHPFIQSWYFGRSPFEKMRKCGNFYPLSIKKFWPDFIRFVC